MSNLASQADIEWLVSPAALPWLQLANSSERSLIALASRLRRELSVERAHLVLEQVELRRRASDKFAHAQQMFFTPLGLEQATDEIVAWYKAQRFPPGTPVADLCCGIGGDLLAIAARGPVTGVDLDCKSATFAMANLRTLNGGSELGGSETKVLQCDVREVKLSDFAAWHIDPDRRPGGKRSTQIDFHEPGPDVLLRLLSECPHAAIKLAPGSNLRDWPNDDNRTDDSLIDTPANDLPWQHAELEWISRAGQCRQLVAWFGDLAISPGARRATKLVVDRPEHEDRPSTAPAIRSYSFVSRDRAVPPTIAAKIGRYIFEPDAALLAARLADHHAIELGLQGVARDVAYYTADHAIDNPLWAQFEVREVMPYQPKRLKSWLRERRIGRLEVKKRGVDLDPAAVQRELSVLGDESMTLLLCRIAGRITAILAKRTS